MIDAAMVDGTTLLAQLILSLRNHGLWRDERASNLLDGGAPFYDTCADGVTQAGVAPRSSLTPGTLRPSGVYRVTAAEIRARWTPPRT